MAINTGVDIDESMEFDNTSSPMWDTSVKAAAYRVADSIGRDRDEVMDYITSETRAWQESFQKNHLKPIFDGLVDKSREIFRQNVPIWSGNMHDFSISSEVKESSVKNNVVTIKARVGVDSEKIGDPSHWTAFTLKRGRNAGRTAYYYKTKDYRMYPGVDYSGAVNAGIIPNTHSKGFVDDIEEKINEMIERELG